MGLRIKPDDPDRVNRKARCLREEPYNLEHSKSPGRSSQYGLKLLGDGAQRVKGASTRMPALYKGIGNGNEDALHAPSYNCMEQMQIMTN